MIRGIRDVKEAGHRGAQKEAKAWAEEENYPKGAKRRKALDYLEMAEFPRFLLGGEDEGPLVPLAGGKIVYEGGETWTYWAVYSLAEYKTWALTFEEDDLTSPNDDTDVCPNCGGVGYTSYRDQGHRCPKCGDIYWTRGDRIEALASQLFGGACRSYGGPGRVFHDTPWARISRTRILVKQRGGLDV